MGEIMFTYKSYQADYNVLYRGIVLRTTRLIHHSIIVYLREI